MTDLTNKISGAIGELPEIHSARVHENDMVLGNFEGSGYNLTYMKRERQERCSPSRNLRCNLVLHLGYGQSSG